MPRDWRDYLDNHLKNSEIVVLLSKEGNLHRLEPVMSINWPKGSLAGGRLTYSDALKTVAEE